MDNGSNSNNRERCRLTDSVFEKLVNIKCNGSFSLIKHSTKLYAIVIHNSNGDYVLIVKVIHSYFMVIVIHDTDQVLIVIVLIILMFKVIVLE